MSSQYLPVSKVSPPPPSFPLQMLLSNTKIAFEFSFARDPRPSKTLASEACAEPLAGNGAAM